MERCLLGRICGLEIAREKEKYYKSGVGKEYLKKILAP
jgi:hypothetical protein